MTVPQDFDWSGAINDCMRSTQYGCLGTVDAEHGIWTNPVYFSWDDKFDFYFISLPDARHMRNIARDARVSFALYSTLPDTSQPVTGIQLAGRAFILRDAQEVAAALAIYYGRVNPATRQPPADPAQARADWSFVRLRPEEMHYFADAHFGDHRQPVDWQTLKIAPPWETA